MLRKYLKTITDYGICVYLMLILVAMPFFNRQGYDRIGSDKAFFFDTSIKYAGRILLPVIVLYLAVTAYQLRREFWSELRSRLSLTDFFAVGYLLALVISWLCSNYRQDALWGSAGWYMGLWPQLALVLCYLLVSKLWTPKKWVVYLGLAVSWVVFLMGYLNRAGIDPLGMTIDNPNFISTIGNINWFCGYQVAIFFAGVALLWQGFEEKLWQKILLMVYVLVGFGTLLIQGSDSGLFTLAAMVLVLFFLSVSDSRKMLMFWQEMVLLGGACVATYIVRGISPGSIDTDSGMALFIITGWRPFFVMIVSALGLILVNWSVKQGKYPEKGLRILSWVMMLGAAAALALLIAAIAINTRRPGSLGALSENPMFTFSVQWGSNRGTTWRAGWMCFKEQDLLHKLVGVGPDAMSLYELQDGSQELQAMLQERFGQSVLTNAHNEWLTVLVDIGVLGLITFVGMMLTGIRRFLKKGSNPITYACGLCLLAYTVNNMFSFQQSMNAATLFALFGIGGAFLTVKEHKDTGEKHKDTGEKQKKQAKKRPQKSKRKRKR